MQDGLRWEKNSISWVRRHGPTGLPARLSRDLGTTKVLLLEVRRDALPGIADVLVKSSVRYWGALLAVTALGTRSRILKVILEGILSQFSFLRRGVMLEWWRASTTNEPRRCVHDCLEGGEIPATGRPTWWCRQGCIQISPDFGLHAKDWWLHL